ncbi:hypothetical protein U27_03161 [Candidatus Vecturithrix granuli]|uniref:Host attachment protein n=1 Tax=Vecturithrix granuli TaxID=1499967 RepID=A0A081BV44_VECG1|nr:hypothetical protein U27_03161 [Candidatus Vecturithrix granuli]
MYLIVVGVIGLVGIIMIVMERDRTMHVKHVGYIIHRGREKGNSKMKTTVGVWIDHRKAIIVVSTDNGEEVVLIISKVEKQLRRSGDSSSQAPADDSRQRALTGHLNRYYDAVIACIREAESILIFGPGEAKGELQKRLEHNNLGERIVEVETVDKMTDRQIAAKVHQYFLVD